MYRGPERTRQWCWPSRQAVFFLFSFPFFSFWFQFLYANYMLYRACAGGLVCEEPSLSLWFLFFDTALLADHAHCKSPRGPGRPFGSYRVDEAWLEWIFPWILSPHQPLQALHYGACSRHCPSTVLAIFCHGLCSVQIVHFINLVWIFQTRLNLSTICLEPSFTEEIDCQFAHLHLFAFWPGQRTLATLHKRWGTVFPILLEI